MKFENDDVWGFKNAIRGMRNPMNSWDKSDSKYLTLDEADGDFGHLTFKDYIIGDNDFDLMQRLIKAGSPHDKFMRQIFVSVDITAPLYWWKEMDQYKVGTTTNSQSTMHKLSTTPITLDCFETDDFDEEWSDNIGIEAACNNIIFCLESLRQQYLKTKDKRYWKELIRWLPESWLQTRTWTANYEVLRNIVHQRQGHKLTEWQSFIDWIKSLPYADELIFYKGEN